MATQRNPKDVKKTRPKTIDTAIIVAIIALVGTLATAFFNSPVIIEWLKNKPSPTAAPAQIQPPSNPPGYSSGQAASAGDGGCLAQQFVDIDSARQFSIEAGATAQDYFMSSQDLSGGDAVGPLGIRLTQNGKTVAGLSLLFFTQSHLFKITSFVDSNCQAVAEYSNASRGGDRNSFEDSDTLQMKLAEGSFSMRLTYIAPAALRFSFLPFP